MTLREYATRSECEEVAWRYNGPEHIWEGPQWVLAKLGGPLWCSPDRGEERYMEPGDWHIGDEWYRDVPGAADFSP